MISGKKIYYVPGLISALLIPVLFWYFGNQKYEEINVGVIDIGIPAKLNDENYKYSFEPLRNWNYQKITVQPNSAKKNSKYYVSKLKELQKRNKKESGIEFILDNNNTYGDFASILNDMAIAKQETYGLDLNKTGHLFAVHFYKDPNKIQNVFGDDTVFYNYTESDYYTGYTKFKFQMSHLPKQTFYLIFGFLIFLNISMFSIKERFLN
ncbi:MAG: hypothetical protein K0R36_2760 [Chryseobacterium sp.]|jgi:hypothetical protein|nr:hypothetical protein [Chryseobacterium sp.]